MKNFLNILIFIGITNLISISVFGNDISKNNTGNDSLTVSHTQGSGEGNVYVTIVDSLHLQGDDYEVYFDKQLFIRNTDGIWVPASMGKVADPNDLTGSTIDISAIYGDTTGVVELSFLLTNNSPNGAWIDGLSITIPSGINIIDAPEFEAGGGTITPILDGQTINMGLVDGQLTQDGIFHGNEEWKLLVSTFVCPQIIDWTIYDDGWQGQPVNVVGQTSINEILFETKTENHWNLKNVTDNQVILEDQTVIMGYDLYTGEFVGDPIIDGFQISVEADYDTAVTIDKITFNGMLFPGSTGPFSGWGWEIGDYTDFGSETGRAKEVIGFGTLDPIILGKDYKFIFTGQLDTIDVNGQTVIITKDASGSMATLYGARYYELGDHPLNPNQGNNEAFLVRVPFEVWNIDDNIQVNYQIYDRINIIPNSNAFKVWNDDNRMYGEVINTPYTEEVADTNVIGDFYTWNHVWWISPWQQGDIVEIKYRTPITENDKFQFTTPTPVVSVNDKMAPNNFKLMQNYPNPFNPSTTVDYSLAMKSYVTLKVFDVLGNEIITLVNAEKTPGNYTVNFQAHNYSSGIYFYKIEANSLNGKNSFVDIKKMILLK
jgi:type IX secretion system substrate protein